MNLSGASVEFAAYHYDPVEGWHEHVWTVTGQRTAKPFRDGRDLHPKLLAALERLTVMEEGQRRFPLTLWSNESIAEALVADMAIPKYVIRIDITRPGHSVQMWRAA